MTERKEQCPHEGSLNAKLFALGIGEATWFESTLGELVTLSRRATAQSRYPKEMKGFRYSCRTFTAVSSAKLGEVTYLLKVERIG